jgi:thiol:disulfide interchange protein
MTRRMRSTTKSTISSTIRSNVGARKGGFVSAAKIILLGALLVAPVAGNTAGYDPSRNPDQDLQQVIKQAQQDGKRILLVVGGEWCVWCKILDNFVRSNSDIQALWSGNFITLEVNYSPENQNSNFLRRYPAIRGYPHLFVLEKDGKFLHSQDTSPLESGHSYSKERMKRFLEKWKP